ncbi:MAG: GvpL/GvpF family gas vesicle protein [Nannocystaceae bacterium]
MPLTNSIDPSLVRDRAIYVFCALDTSFKLPEIEGLEGTSIFPISSENFQVAACGVDLEVWTGEDAEARLADVKWLGPRALRHELINERLMHQTTIFPLRFGALFSTVERVEQWLAANHDAMATYFDTVGGHEEWAVRGWLKQDTCRQTLAERDPRNHDLPISPGARYLQKKRLERDAVTQVRGWVRTATQKLADHLSQETVAMLQTPAGRVEAHNPADERSCVLNFACLLPRGQIRTLQSSLDPLLDSWEPFGLSLELNGPWPAYHFTPTLEAST